MTPELRLVVQDASYSWGSGGLRIPHRYYFLQSRTAESPWQTLPTVLFDNLTLSERDEIRAFIDKQCMPRPRAPQTDRTA